MWNFTRFLCHRPKRPKHLEFSMTPVFTIKRLPKVVTELLVIVLTKLTSGVFVTRSRLAKYFKLQMQVLCYQGFDFCIIYLLAKC